MPQPRKRPEYPNPLRLNLGSGPSRFRGFKNVDTVPEWADVVHDLNDPLPFPDDSADVIFASHVIEHFPAFDIQRILQDWCRVLKRREGVLFGFVPDGKRVAERYLEAVVANDRYTKLVMVTNMCGGWTNNHYIGPGQVHHYLYDEDSLTETLYRGGFSPVRVIAQEAGPLDYRLVFAAGKGIYDLGDITHIGVTIQVPWHPGALGPEEGE